MRIRLKGVHSVRGAKRTYYYAWRGGRRLRGEPGSAEFVTSFNEAVRQRAAPPDDGTLFSLIAVYKTSTEFTQLAPRTQADYLKHIRHIEEEFGSFPLNALPLPAARGIFKEWRDKLAKRSLRQADYAWVVLARIQGPRAHYG